MSAALLLPSSPCSPSKTCWTPCNSSPTQTSKCVDWSAAGSLTICDLRWDGSTTNCLGQARAGEHSASIHSDWRERAEGSGLRQGRETDGPQANMIIKDCAQKKHIAHYIYIHTMPYKNAYNAQVAQQVRQMSQKHVNREKDQRLCNQLRDSVASGVVRNALP